MTDLAGLPRVALGTWLLGKDGDIESTVAYALEVAGYRHIDCAECYENQVAIGNALANVFTRGKVVRADLWVTSKIWNQHHDPGDVEPTCRKILGELRLDYLDLLLVHWPCAFLKNANDDLTPRDSQNRVIFDEKKTVAAMWPALEALVEKGLVRHIGVSNFQFEALEKLRLTARIQPFANQCEWNLWMQQAALRDYCDRRGIWFEGYCPLGSSAWQQGRVPYLLADAELVAIAKEIGRSAAAVELRFLLQTGGPRTLVIAKSKTPAHLSENLDLGFELSAAQVERLKSRNRCFRCCNPGIHWGRDLFGDGW